MRYTYRCREGHLREVEHPMGANVRVVCEGDHHGFTCLHTMHIVVKSPQIRIRHAMRGDMRDYREDLARFPNDPEALVDGPTALRKLKDRRKRQGWDLQPLRSAPGEAVLPVEEPSSAQIVRESYDEARREVGGR